MRLSAASVVPTDTKSVELECVMPATSPIQADASSPSLVVVGQYSLPVDASLSNITSCQRGKNVPVESGTDYMYTSIYLCTQEV